MKRYYFTLGTFHHLVHRGSRQMNIVHDDEDRWHFVKSLLFLNDTHQNHNWLRDISKNKEIGVLARPEHWPPQDQLVKIVAFCLHDNHFHLLVKEIREDGISSFMHRLPNSMTLRYNKKYAGSGTIFQGSYKSRLVESDADLHNLALYIMAKNVMERFPEGGIKGAVQNFEKAWQWALTDPFSSFADYGRGRNSPVLDKDILENRFTPACFKKETQQYIESYMKKNI